MAQRVKKQFFKILPISMVVLMVFAVAIGIWQNNPPDAQAAAPSGTMTATTLLMKGNETKAINPITIVDSGAEITALNDIQILIPATFVDTTWDATDTTATIDVTGNTTGTVSTTVSYTTTNYANDTLVLDVTADFTSGDQVIVSDLSFVSANPGTNNSQALNWSVDAGANFSAGSSATLTVDTVAPTVTDGNISIAGGSGTAGAYIIGDTITVTWDAATDGTTDLGSAAADLSGWGGGAAVAMTDTTACGGTNADNVWEACYTIVAGAIDATNVNATVTATDAAGNVTGPVSDTTNATVDNVAPTPTDGNISIAGGSGTAGAYIIGDTITVTWDAATDSVTDLASAAADLSGWGGGAAVAMTDTTACGGTNADNVWEACYTIVAGAIDATNVNATVTATDDAGNVAGPVSDTTNATVDNSIPLPTSVAIDMDAGTLTTVFSENMDTSIDVDETQVTFQDAATATTSYTLTTSTSAWTPPATLVVTLSAVDLNAIKADTGMYTVQGNSYMTITDGSLSGVTDDAGNPMAAIPDGSGGMVSSYTADTTAPTLNAGSLTADESACTGTGGVCKIGDIITFTWDNSAGGDNPTGYNGDVASVVADLTNFGGGAAQAMYDDGSNGDATPSDGIWTYDLTVAADNDDGTLSFTATATDYASNATGPVSSTDQAPVDDIAPTISVAGTITLTNDLGSDGVASIGDTITYAAGTPGAADGDSWTVDLSAYGLSATAAPGPYVIIADNDDGAFSATETITDNGGNTATGAVTLSGFTNIDNIAPTISVAGTITLTNDLGSDGVASIGDTITYAAGTPGVADGDSWTVDLSAYGLSATAAPGPYVIIADNDDGAFSATETITDNGGNTATGAVTLSGFTNIDNIAPVLTGVDEFDVNGDGKIDETILTFNDNIIDANVNPADFTIGGTTADTVLATTSTNGTDANVANDQEITISVAAGVTGTEAKAVGYTAGSLTDDGGNLLANTTFVAGSVTDQADPVILTTTPANSALVVLINASVVVTFSEPMNTGTVTQTSTPDPGGWSAVWSGGNTIATYSHTAFNFATAYTEQITAGTGADGNALAAGPVANPWSFTTQSAGGGGGGGGGGAVTAPTCSVSINSGATSTDTLDVTLNLTVANTPTEMLIANDLSFVGAAWETLATSKSWTLSGTDTDYGTKTVYVLVKNSAGVTSNTCSDTIEYVAAGTEPLPPPEEPVVVPDENLILHDPEPAGPLPSGVSVGTLVKRADMPTVYFIDQDNRRHSFPSQSVYLSWFSDFSNVQTISDATLAAIPLGSNVTMRPGTWLIKIQSDPKVYAVEPYGVIRWVQSEAIAKSLYGADWSNRIVDVDPTFFINYQPGSSVASAMHPTGSIIQYSGSSTVFYIDKGLKRMIPSDVFASDLFQDKFIAKDISTSISYTSGADFPAMTADQLLSLR